MKKDQKNFLATDMFTDIRNLINIIDEVRDYGLDNQISLPRIAVLGTQSSGKSSLLENIVGLDFLPRGSGVVTRRPLELRMVHMDPRKSDSKPYATFEDEKAAKKYTDFNQVRQAIQKKTDDLAGKGGHIIKQPIKLKVYSTDCPDLTIIDLPGITRIDVKGQKDIQKITVDLAKHYCIDSNTIILCVIPGNQDLSTSDGLKLAREWDNAGQRTIGVITKIDIMDKGTSAVKMISNEEIHLKLGYIGVVNRAQEDINNRVPVEVALKRQAEFFSGHKQYRNLNENLLGTKALTSKLSEQLVVGIKRSLPDILKKIQQKLAELKQQLDAMGQAPPASSHEKSNFLMTLIAQFSNDYRNILSGRYVANSKKQTQDIGKGAVIKSKFKAMLDQFTLQSYKCSKGYSNSDIQASIKSHQGDYISGFPSMQCFRSLLTPQIYKIKVPIDNVLDEIYQELIELANQLNDKVFSRFSNLSVLISEITNNKLEDYRDQTMKMLDTIMEAEMHSIFTNNQRYLSARDDLLAKSASKNEDAHSIFITQIRQRLDGYFQIIVHVLNDSIPKIIGFFLVKQSQDNLQMILFNQLNRQHILQMLGEPKQAEENRKRIQVRIKTLQKSQKALKKDPTVSKFLNDDDD